MGGGRSGDRVSRRKCDLERRGSGFESRVARNVLTIIQRELRLGPQLAERQAQRLSGLGFDTDQDLVAAIRAGQCDDAWKRVGAVVAASVRDQLRVANPSHGNVPVRST
ncbi:MAG: DUF6285 domain-containing protein [Acidimicrobiales bacterium]